MLARSLRAILITVGLTTALPGHAAVTLSDYAVQTFGDFRSAGGGSVFDGGLAVGGNAYINSERIGANLNKSANGTAVVAVKGDVTYQYSKMSHGDVVYGGKDLNPAGHSGKDAPANGTVRQGETIDFAAYEAQARGWSSDLAEMAANGVFAQQWGAGTLTADAAGLNIFNLSGAEMAKQNIYSLKFLGDPAAKFVINVDAASFNRSLQFFTGGYGADSILFNFYNAETITIGGWKYNGSILAPNALVTLNGNDIRGSVVSNSFAAGGTRIGGAAFNGLPAVSVPLPDEVVAVPEPATWAMLIVGFMLMGAILRRRRPELSYVTD